MAFNLVRDEHLCSAVILLLELHKIKRIHRVKMLTPETAMYHYSLCVAWRLVAQEMSNCPLYSPSTPQDNDRRDFLTLFLHSLGASVIKFFLDLYVKCTWKRPHLKYKKSNFGGVCFLYFISLKTT